MEKLKRGGRFGGMTIDSQGAQKWKNSRVVASFRGWPLIPSEPDNGKIQEWLLVLGDDH